MRKDRGVLAVLIGGLALACAANPVFAQSSKWADFGASLAGPRVEQAADLVETTKTGSQASRDYARCLEDRSVELARTGVDAYQAIRGAQGECQSERSEFYSAVYEDRRASSGHKASLAFANQMLSYFDEDVNAKLPPVVMRAAPLLPRTPAPDRYGQLEKIKALLDSGTITPAEFEAEKAKILSSD